MKTFLFVSAAILLCSGCRTALPVFPDNSPAQTDAREGSPPIEAILMKDIDPTAMARPAKLPSTNTGGHEHHH